MLDGGKDGSRTNPDPSKWEKPNDDGKHAEAAKRIKATVWRQYHRHARPSKGMAR
jgi:hypothetical protein